jgi:hypothetical protein
MLQPTVSVDQPAVNLPEPVKRERKRRIPARIAKAISLIVDGECRTYKAAAERANLNPSYFSQALQKPHIRVFYERKARENLGAGILRASARVLELMDGDSEHVAFDASKHVLAIAGIKPVADAQLNVNIELKAGYVIDLSEPNRAERSAAFTQIDATATEIVQCSTDQGQFDQ